MFGRIAIAAGFLLVALAEAHAMDFTWCDDTTVHASGPIEEGDAAKFAALPLRSSKSYRRPGKRV